MGIVKNQALRNTVIQYIGILIGYANMVLLFPKFLTLEQFGLTRLLITIGILFMQISSLGTNKILLKFYPFFKTEDKKNHGIFFLALLISLVGFCFFSVIFLLFQEQIVRFYAEKSILFSNNFLYVLPLSFLLLTTTIIESYLMAMLNTILSNFLKNVLLRIFWLIAIVAYVYNLISFQLFLNLFIYSYAINLLILLVYLKNKGLLNLSPDFTFLRPVLIKLIISYGLFSILSGISHLLVNRIDILMISNMKGLTDVAVYSVVFSLAMVINVPAQAIGRITFPIISEKMKRKQFADVEKLYKQTALINFLISGFIFLCIWCSIDNFFTLLPPKYASGKWVMLFIGIAKIFEISTGINWQIIISSKYYKFDTIAAFFLVIITTSGNYLLIPIYGITGAAFASLISIVSYNLAKLIFIKIKLKMQPYSPKVFLGIISLAIPFLIVHYLPFTLNIYVDTMVRSLVLVSIYAPLVYFLKIAKEINESVDKTLIRFGFTKK